MVGALGTQPVAVPEARDGQPAVLPGAVGAQEEQPAGVPAVPQARYQQLAVALELADQDGHGQGMLAAEELHLQQAQAADTAGGLKAAESGLRKLVAKSRQTRQEMVNHVVVLIDISGSMLRWWHKLLQALRAFFSVLAQQSRDDKVSVVCFNDQAFQLLTVADVGTDDVALLLHARPYTPQGGTSYAPAWEEAAKCAILGPAHAHLVVLFITDGEAADIPQAGRAAAALWQSRQSHAGMRTAVVNIDHSVPDSILEPLVRAGNGGQTCMEVGGAEAPLLIGVPATDMVPTLQGVATFCCSEPGVPWPRSFECHALCTLIAQFGLGEPLRQVLAGVAPFLHRGAHALRPRLPVGGSEDMDEDGVGTLQCTAISAPGCLPVTQDVGHTEPPAVIAPQEASAIASEMYASNLLFRSTMLGGGAEFDPEPASEPLLHVRLNRMPGPVWRELSAGRSLARVRRLLGDSWRHHLAPNVSVLLFVEPWQYERAARLILAQAAQQQQDEGDGQPNPQRFAIGAAKGRDIIIAASLEGLLLEALERASQAGRSAQGGRIIRRQQIGTVLSAEGGREGGSSAAATALRPLRPHQQGLQGFRVDRWGFVDQMDEGMPNISPVGPRSAP